MAAARSRTVPIHMTNQLICLRVNFFRLPVITPIKSYSGLRLLVHNKNTLKESDLRFSNASKFLDLFVGACETEIASARGPGPVLLLLRSTHISRVVLMIRGSGRVLSRWENPARVVLMRRSIITFEERPNTRERNRQRVFFYLLWRPRGTPG